MGITPTLKGFEALPVTRVLVHYNYGLVNLVFRPWYIEVQSLRDLVVGKMPQAGYVHGATSVTLISWSGK